jgi:16S rRNA (guanine527-N7)-methyltransferase
VIDSEAAARAFVAQIGDAAALERLDSFAALLAEESERQNLIAKGTLPSLWQRHIADSAQLLLHVSRGTDLGPWLDLGTGAGFPGLVVAALRPAWDVRLVESRKRRIEWLERARERLGLANCRVLGARLENVDSFAAGVISARAFAPMVKLLDLSLRFSTSETLWLLPKGRSAAQELAGIPPRFAAMFHVEQSHTDAASGIIVGRGAGKRGTQ